MHPRWGEGRRKQGRVYGLWAVGRRGCDNDRCLASSGFNRRGERRKNAQSQIGPLGVSAGCDWITFTTTGERKVHPEHERISRVESSKKTG